MDDSATMRRMVCNTLCSAGFTLLEGVNGNDALRKVGRAPLAPRVVSAHTVTVAPHADALRAGPDPIR